jgi:tripartite-type tricarboxylate transporter receptor subunit TctC
VVHLSVPAQRLKQLIALAASGSERSLALPQLPTVAEAGVPGYAVTSWFGLVAPARTPTEVIEKLNAVLTSAMNGRDMRERLAVEGAEPAPGSPSEFGKHIAAETTIWAKVVKAAGLNP